MRDNNEFDAIECNYLECYAGMGVAGHLQCFLGGDYTNPKCEKFVDEEVELKRQGINLCYRRLP